MVFFLFYYNLIDSKKLTAEKRESLLGSIDQVDSIGYVIRILTPKEICANMLQA
jgi:ribonuclease HII